MKCHAKHLMKEEEREEADRHVREWKEELDKGDSGDMMRAAMQKQFEEGEKLIKKSKKLRWLETFHKHYLESHRRTKIMVENMEKHS